MAEIIFYVGLGIFIIGGIGLLIAAFRTGILWGLAVLLIAPVSIIYLIVHWQDAKGPFKLQLLGILVILGLAYANGGLELPGSVSSSFSNLNVLRPENSNFYSSNLSSPHFKCDGRQHCSQMTSREEAVFFIRNCPNTKMDGDNDGVPCENDSRF
ncbi:excalibur calcium-binding domain-containing protein [Microbulbifer pacificus]|uniref:Excalibur calcium-binding domain-containing protein n=1 Tax=Microbulbifer pacificus TaxID=407164 RepID=A0AAU0N1Z8_9GAMM|nr:excalibur calcium-binding domain-containing protein [Microbulbifer pacificus]WOX06133.1 excalibur calcium-binding domain-containing protein [Microbulbifer pacificus]